MLPDAIEHCIVFMNYWDVSGVFWSFSKCNIKIPHLPADPYNHSCLGHGHFQDFIGLTQCGHEAQAWMWL